MICYEILIIKLIEQNIANFFQTTDNNFKIGWVEVDFLNFLTSEPSLSRLL